MTVRGTRMQRTDDGTIATNTRLLKELHEQLVLAARKSFRSVNGEINHRLTQSLRSEEAAT